MGYTKLNLLFGSLQTDASTAITSMSASNFLQVDEGFEVALKQEMSPLKQISGGFGQSESVPGAASCDVKIKTYLDTPQKIDSTTCHLPTCDPYLQASGLKPYRYQSQNGWNQEYTPYSTDATARMTVWQSTVSSSGWATYTKAANTAFDFDINLEIGKPADLSLTGRGICQAVSDAPRFALRSSCPSRHRAIPATIGLPC